MYHIGEWLNKNYKPFIHFVSQFPIIYTDVDTCYECSLITGIKSDLRLCSHMASSYSASDHNFKLEEFDPMPTTAVAMPPSKC